jgi:hypothetical protein
MFDDRRIKAEIMEDPTPDKYHEMQRNNLMVIVAIIVAALALFVVVQKVKHGVPNCHMAGFVHCSWTQFPYH